MPSANPQIAACLDLVRAISVTHSADDIYERSLDALADALGVSRAAVLLFDPDGAMRFKAQRGLSEAYRRAVEGHTPWAPDTKDAVPILVRDVATDESLGNFRPVFEAEGIAALAFIPLVSATGVIGKFMLYFDQARSLSPGDLQIAELIASSIAFAIERMRAVTQARRSEERLLFALDAASMGTWDWDLASQQVRWSQNLERIHGLPAGTFDGTFASYEREIHPDDRARVLSSIQLALSGGAMHEVEYRLVAPDGTVRWCEGKGRVEYEDGAPVAMTGVCMMVTARKEAEMARLAAAEEAGRMKDEFLATLSHEMRTPLNAILGWVRILEAETVAPEQTRRAVEVIARNAGLQAQLIEDILDVSRIITGKLDLEHLPVNITELVEATCRAALPAADAKHVRLTARVAEDLPPIQGDPRRLHQVLGNVVSNAVKFTPSGGAVDITAEVEGGTITVRVRDTGIGIPPEFLPHVFERFRQADSRTTRRHGGLGLGLAIARHLVEQHGGEIDAESGGASQGTTVTIRLPVGLPAPPRSSAPAPVDTSWRLDGNIILVVDDQRDSRELLAMLLAERGGDVRSCDSACGALEILGSAHIDLILADIAMPDVDGYELIGLLRARESSVPAVAVSAYARPEDRERALRLGYDAYCAKPIDVAQLLETISTVLAQRDCGLREASASPALAPTPEAI